MDGTMIKSPSVSSLRGSADTFESRIKIPKAPRELEEGPKKSQDGTEQKQRQSLELGRNQLQRPGAGGAGRGRGSKPQALARGG